MEKNKKQGISGAGRLFNVKSGITVGKGSCTACSGEADAIGNGVQHCKFPGKTGWLWEICKL